MGVVHEDYRLDAPRAGVEVEYVRAVEGHPGAVFEAPVVQIIGDRAQVALGAHQHVVHGELRSFRGLRDLLDELPHREPPEKRRLDPAIGYEERRRLVRIPRLERLQILGPRALHSYSPQASPEGRTRKT